MLAYGAEDMSVSNGFQGDISTKEILLVPPFFSPSRVMITLNLSQDSLRAADDACLVISLLDHGPILAEGCGALGHVTIDAYRIEHEERMVIMLRLGKQDV